MYIEIDGGVAFDDPRVRARFLECLGGPCAVCGAVSTDVAVCLAGPDLKQLMATPPGVVGVVPVPVCGWCAGPGRARAEAAIEAAVAREVAERLAAN
jgi:hypothetical protein